jgi:hypothetical protein
MVEFSDDISTPTEQDLESCYGSKYLSAADLGDRKIKVRIARIKKEELRQDNGSSRSKFVIFFDNLDNGLVVNATNKNLLVASLGRNPQGWIGAQVGLFAEEVQFSGRTVRGLRLRVLAKPDASSPTPIPKPAPKPTPTPAAAAANPWPDQPGDPGFDPHLNPSPEFDEAAE